MPFLNDEGKDEGQEGARVPLDQIAPRTFQLRKGFKYRPKGAPLNGSEDILVPAHDPNKGCDKSVNRGNCTDLASVPSALWWFIAPFGHQTRAALLHDHLCHLASYLSKTDPAEGLKERLRADALFREALESSDVRWGRRWIMWAAVYLMGLAKHSILRFAALCLLIVACLSATVWISFADSWRQAISTGAILVMVSTFLPFVWTGDGRVVPVAVLTIPVLLPITILIYVITFLYYLPDLFEAIILRAKGKDVPLPVPAPTRYLPGRF